MKFGKLIVNSLTGLRKLRNAEYIEEFDESDLVDDEFNWFVGWVILLIIEAILLIIIMHKCFPKKEPVVIKELMIYPIKSCKGISVKSATVAKTGFEHDRTFMIINEKDSKFVSQRKYPTMALIETVIDGETLIVSAPHKTEKTLIIPLIEPSAKATRTVTVWGDECQAYDMGEDCARWFCKILGANYGFPSGCELRLVRFSSSFTRKTEEKFAPENGQTGFADGYPFLIASQASLNALNDKLLEAGSQTITMANFRPNIVCDNCDAFDEDIWKTIKIKDLSMSVCKPCSRCTIPNVNPDNGTFSTVNEPTKTLKSFRNGKMLAFDKEFGEKKWSGQVFFGQNLDHGGVEGTVIKVGDEIKYK